MVNVNSIQPSTVFAWFMLIMVIRRIILIIIIGIAGRNRPVQPGRVPEDRFLKRGQVATTTTTTGEGVPPVFSKDVRANRVINNDAENDTYFLILLFATAIFSDPVNGDCIRTIVYGAVYLFLRIFYALAYIFALQPWRTLTFFLGLACTLACNIDLVIILSRRNN